MAADEELPIVLKKLKIAPSLPQVKLFNRHLTVSLNPFFVNDIESGEKDCKVLFGSAAPIPLPTQIDQRQRGGLQNCRKCRRSKSDDLLDDFKLLPTSFSLEDFVSEKLRTTPKIQKQPMKKNSTGGSSSKRKVVLREPILRALQTCCHIQNTARRKLITDTGVAGGEDRNDYTNKSTESQLSELPSTSSGISNFCDLIKECQAMLQENVDFSNSNGLSESRRNSKKFTTMQSTNSRAKIETTDRMYPVTPEILSNSNISIIASEPSNLTTRANNTTCSQQAASTQCNHTHANTGVAGAGANSADDVTIDELASYFDTLVHIPKKMSSMAEMMYI